MPGIGWSPLERGSFTQNIMRAQILLDRGVCLSFYSTVGMLVGLLYYTVRLKPAQAKGVHEHFNVFG